MKQRKKQRKRNTGNKLPPGTFGIWLGSCFPLPPCASLLVCLWLREDPVKAACLVFTLNSLLTFCAYAADKRAAEKEMRRIPEFALHCWEFFGGWPGAFIAQRLLHHKNRKLPYQIVFYLIVLLQTGLLILWKFRFSGWLMNRG